MASITITVPDNKANKVYDAFKRTFGDPTINPSTAQKIAFVKGCIEDRIIEITYLDEKRLAIETASTGVVKDTGVVS